MPRLSGWLLKAEGQPLPPDDLVNALDVWFAGSGCELWAEDNANGLASTLDLIPGWAGWEGWDQNTKNEKLRALLKTTRDRIVLIPPGHALAGHLTELWGDDTWRSAFEEGLARALDHLPEWKYWDATSDLTLQTLHQWLTPLPWGAEPEPLERADEPEKPEKQSGASSVTAQASVPTMKLPEFLAKTSWIPEFATFYQVAPLCSRLATAFKWPKEDWYSDQGYMTALFNWLTANLPGTLAALGQFGEDPSLTKQIEWLQQVVLGSEEVLGGPWSDSDDDGDSDHEPDDQGPGPAPAPAPAPAAAGGLACYLCGQMTLSFYPIALYRNFNGTQQCRFCWRPITDEVYGDRDLLVCGNVACSGVFHHYHPAQNWVDERALDEPEE